MSALLEALPRWRRPALVLLAVLTLALASQIGALRAELEPELLVRPEPEHVARVDRLLGGFPDRADPVVVVIRAPDVLAPAPLAYGHEIAHGLAVLPWVARVDALTTTPVPSASREDASITLDSIDDEPAPALDGPLARLAATDPARFPMGLLSVAERTGGALELRPLIEGEGVSAEDAARVREVVERAPWVRGRGIDDAGELLVIAAVPNVRGEALERAVREARGWLAARPAPEGVEVRVGGMPVVRAAMLDALAKDRARLVGLALAGSFLVLVLGFRSFAGVLLPLGAAGMTSGMVVGAMALLDEPINLLNNVVPPLLITLGLGDAVHLLVRYGEEHRREPDRVEAAKRTMRAMTGACFLTSATTAVGFGSLVASDAEVLRRFAVTAALGVALAYLVTIVFLPAALPDFRVPRWRGGAATARLVGRVAAVAARRAGVVVVASLLVLCASLALGARVRMDSALLEQLDPSSEEARTARVLEERMGGVRSLEIGLAGEPGRYASSAGARELDALEAWLRAQPGVLLVSSATTPARELWAHLAGEREGAFEGEARTRALFALLHEVAPGTLARFSDRGASRARVEVRLADRGEQHLGALLDRLEARLAALPVEAVVGGEAERSSRGLGRLVEDLVTSLGVAVLIIFAMLGALLRSARLALISVLPNVLPLAVTLAYMAVRGIPLHAGTAIVFTVSIGLVVDGTIHVLARHREEQRRGRSRARALVAALRGSGRAVVIGAATMLFGFAALLFASFVPIRWFAELSIVAIATALVADLVVLPALLALFGGRAQAPAALRS